MKKASARPRASSGAGSRGGAGGRYGTTAITAVGRQRPVQVREDDAVGMRGTAGLEPHGIGQPGGVDDEQHQVAASREERLGRDVHLLRRREVHEADVGQRRRPDRAVGQRGRHWAGSIRWRSTSGGTPAILPRPGRGQPAVGARGGSGSMPRAFSADSIASLTVRTTSTRAQRLSSAATTCHGATAVSVRSSISSTAAS